MRSASALTSVLVLWLSLSCAKGSTAPSTPPVVTGYVLVDSVLAGGSGGFFMGAASSDLSLVAIGPYVADANSSKNLTFFDASGRVLARADVGNSVWAVAMTPDGSKTVVGSDDENLYVFTGTTLAHRGRPIPGNTQIRGVAISRDGRYVGAGGARFTLLDLGAATPLQPIFVDSATDQLRAVDFSANGRFVAYGGQAMPAGASPITIMGIYDLARRQRVQLDSIPCTGCSNAELRHLSISSDGSRIVAGDWGDRLHYFVRADTVGRWQRVQTIEIGSRVYWTDMSEDDALVVVGTQGSNVRLYAVGAGSLTLLWQRPDAATPLDPPMDGGQRTVSITPDGRYITAATRGGGGGGGQIYVFSRSGEVIFERRSPAVQSGGAWLGPNGAMPEVWFARLSDEGTKAVYAGWSGAAYFLRARP